MRNGETDAWNELIARFEGRLLAFVESRLGRRAPSEDVVQEAFIGFLTSLPNFDESRPLESYLFSIAAHKLTDHLRREGRRPTLPLATAGSQDDWDVPAGGRNVSSAMRSSERRSLEAEALVIALQDQFDHWKKRGDWIKIECMELLQVRGVTNKDAAKKLGLSEQQVANYKFDFLARLRKAIRGQGLNQDVFPELAETE
ncbi:MAG: sigma-70 family RNA polymerase sigma factor [Planctomycetales bacterium]